MTNAEDRREDAEPMTVEEIEELQEARNYCQRCIQDNPCIFKILNHTCPDPYWYKSD